MSRYVVDAPVVVRMLDLRLAVPADHQLLAPTLMRSEVLQALYRAVETGALTEAEGLERLSTFAAMKIRYLGDKVLRRRAWQIAQELGWDSTHRAEYVSLTQLQADAFITLDTALADELAGVVDLADFNVLT